MAFRVDITETAADDMERAFDYIAGDAPRNASKWYRRLLKRIDSLKTFPHRCQIAHESSLLGFEVRQLMYGPYRILFIVEGSRVLILRVRHGAQRQW